MSSNLVQSILQELRFALAPLFDYSESRSTRIQLLKAIGFRPNMVNTASLEQIVANLNNTYNALATSLSNPAANLSELNSQIRSFSTLTDSLNDLSAALPVGNNGAIDVELVKDLLAFLFCGYMQALHGKAYALLVLLELVEEPVDGINVAPVISAIGEIIRYGYGKYVVHFDRISILLNNPKEYLKLAYYPNYPAGLLNRNISNQMADKLFPRLASFLSMLGFDATYGLRDYGYLNYGPVSSDLMQHMLTVELNHNSPDKHFGFTLSLSSADDGDLGLVISPFGATAYQRKIGNWLVDFLLTANIRGLAIGPQGVLLDGTGSFGAEVSIEKLPDNGGNAFQFGAATGTYLSIGQVAFNAGINVTNGHADYGFVAQARQAKFVLKPEGSGGFLKAIIPANGISGTFDLGLGWSVANGFYFAGSGTTKSRYVINNSGVDRLLSINAFIIELAADNQGLTLNSTVSGLVTLGPVQIGLEEIGIAALLTFPSSHGNLGIANADIAFKFPSGIKIEIDSDSLTGGGYLFLDPTHHQYGGAAHLSFKDKINLNALGLLQTELPNNQPGYSFLLLITAQFNAIQLGMGFTLNAVGGLVGINRSVSTSFLRGLVAAGRQDTLLFPANVLDNPQEALAIVDSAFPATEGKYVFGLMARIGWGTPNLITLDVALIIQLPAPVRLVLLGILKATLPSESSPMVRIRADFLGIVDFGAKQVSFDATLVDSRILQFVLTGDMAFRLYQGDNPVFVLTAGGFHPAFQPPANADLPTLHRMTLALSQGGDFRLTLTSYLAITSNTVQFGSRLDLYVGLPASYYIEGFLAFDALFQFNPFHVEVWIGAGVAIKRNGSAKLSIGLSLLVSGPGPWHVAGEGSFKILFFRIRFRVDRTFGSNTAQPALPTTNVRQLLLGALHETANWEIEAPAARASSTTVLRTEESPTELVVDPGGALLVRQKLVPLGFPIEVYGNTRPVNGSRFVITSVLFGEGTPAPEAVSDVRDAFAPAQFQRLSDAQKLSAPSFQLLRNGIRVEALDGLVGSGGTTQTVKFELKVIEPALADTDTSGRTTTTGITISPSTDYVKTTLPGQSFQGLARNGAVGRSRRSYEQRRPSRKAPDQVLWDEDAYAVVLTRNLQLAPGAPNPFVTEAEATAYLTQQLGLRPALAGAWQVVPVYQLDVSAPAVAATLATA